MEERNRLWWKRGLRGKRDQPVAGAEDRLVGGRGWADVQIGQGGSMEGDNLAERIARREAARIVSWWRKESRMGCAGAGSGQDGLPAQDLPMWAAGGWRLGLHSGATGAVGARVAERCACGLFAAPRRTCLPRCAVLSVRVCVRTGMAWSSDLLSVLLDVWLLASPLPSLGCGSCVPNSLICTPACKGAWNLAQSLERSAAHRTQKASAGGTAAAAQANRGQGVDAVRGRARDVVGVGDVGAPARGCTGTWVRDSWHPAVRRFPETCRSQSHSGPPCCSL